MFCFILPLAWSWGDETFTVRKKWAAAGGPRGLGPRCVLARLCLGSGHSGRGLLFKFVGFHGSAPRNNPLADG